MATQIEKFALEHRATVLSKEEGEKFFELLTRCKYNPKKTRQGDGFVLVETPQSIPGGSFVIEGGSK